VTVMVMQTHYHVKSTAREVGRKRGTPIYAWESAKVVAKDRATVCNITLKIRREKLVECPGFSCRFGAKRAWVTARVTLFAVPLNAVKPRVRAGC
jgi:hypothetical protein